MSLFGYPAKVKHYQAIIDSWGRVSGYLDPVEKAAKVIEEQKLIRVTSKVGTENVYSTEEIVSVAEIHLEGLHKVGLHDYFEHINELNEVTRFDVKHVEIKKTMGTDGVKKVIVYA